MATVQSSNTKGPQKWLFSSDAPVTRCRSWTTYHISIVFWYASWWFQLKNMLVKLDHFPNFRGKNKKCLSCYHLYSIFHVYVFLPGSGGCHSNFTHGFYSPLSPAPLAGPLATGGGFTGTLWQIVGDMGQFPGYNGITRLLFGRNQNCETYCASTKVDEA